MVQSSDAWERDHASATLVLEGSARRSVPVERHVGPVGVAIGDILASNYGAN